MIDVESFGADRLLGAGAIRACQRWRELPRQCLIARLRDLEAAPFETDLDVVELWMLASWTKCCLLLRKHRLIDLGLLRNLARRE